MNRSPKDPFAKSEDVVVVERNNLFLAAIQQSKIFDKALLTVAAGSFGVTVAFLKDLVPNPFENTLQLLGLCWLSFSLSLVFVISSFLTSTHSIRRQMDILDTPKEKNHWGQITSLLNWLAMLMFVAGLCLWLCFLYWNLFHNHL